MRAGCPWWASRAAASRRVGCPAPRHVGDGLRSVDGCRSAPPRCSRANARLAAQALGAPGTPRIHACPGHEAHGTRGSAQGAAEPQSGAGRTHHLEARSRPDVELAAWRLERSNACRATRRALAGGRRQHPSQAGALLLMGQPLAPRSRATARAKKGTPARPALEGGQQQGASGTACGAVRNVANTHWRWQREHPRCAAGARRKSPTRFRAGASHEWSSGTNSGAHAIVRLHRR